MTVSKNNRMDDVGAQLKNSDILEFKLANNASLHPSIADFLLMHNGGMPEKAVFNYTDLFGTSNAGEVLEFLPLNRADKDDIAHVTSAFQADGRIGMAMLVLARESGGHLVLVHNDTGHVFLWDHEKEEYAPKNCYFLASSLNEFFNEVLYTFD